MKGCSIILFDDFETLDAFGPVEIIGNISLFSEEDIDISFYSLSGGVITSAQSVKVMTQHITDIKKGGALLIPGGYGVRRELDNEDMILFLRSIVEDVDHVLTVCTGSVLLAKTGHLDGRRATSNKMVFDWVTEQGHEVDWVPEARWVKDGKFYTSSGVTAGMDMTLDFVKDTFDMETAESIAEYMEYLWNKDKDLDPFYNVHKD